ncbi:hypothetical protein EDB84DRAFT_1474233 [Lactarius hengduanensis]|nr:hypothetical protein EDB84DRAFT_1474233 [Lactarius hengduanensis]
MAQVCDQFSPFIFRVDNLHVNTTQSPSGQDGVDGEQWLGLVRAFGGAKDLRVAGVHVEDILCALRPADGEHTTDTAVLPALCNLHVQKLNLPLWDIVRSFTTSRRLSGRPVQAFTKGYYSCHICYSDFTKRRELKIHLIGRHAYRRMCSHCSDFERTPGHSHLFREHLENKHPGVARNNAPFSKPLLTGGELNILVHRHSSLRAPEIAAPFTTGIPTELHFR